MHATHPGPASGRAPLSSHALCNGALEHRPGSQYSPRPLKSTQKKTANVKPDFKANLSRPTVSRPGLHKNFEFDCGYHSRRGFFGFFYALAQLLLKALKLTKQTIFATPQKAPDQSVLSRRKTQNLNSGATE
ncbi:hypothetical protein [Pseudomonas mucidolens]|uniref:Uncharacterized protein n=1 Tax=Pseudomonas mucidolens TaxID=46679 RepID=A0A1H2N2Z3_9PSED|nr:hypothetical protein [Pseudomonas mucidolens]SDU99889.1 hypothetical protein SAMN05216202_2901 [Pseudomonas mucidolens]SQH32720.1 Uncharacterised protein [Pseudomonas mucidolens]